MASHRADTAACASPDLASPLRRARATRRHGLCIPFLRRVVRGPQPAELIVEDEHGVQSLGDPLVRTARTLVRAVACAPPGGSA